MELKIDPELKALLGPVTETTDEELDRQLVEAGRPRDPIVIWRGFIVDGHRRYGICKRLKLPFETVDMSAGLPDKTAVMAWMVRQQLARRNVLPGTEQRLLARLSALAGTAKAAETLGVCERTAYRAKAIQKFIGQNFEPQVQAALEGVSAKIPILEKLASVVPTAEMQIDLIRQVKDGEFANLARALDGEDEPDTVSSPEPAVQDFVDAIVAAGLELKKSLDKFSGHKPSGFHQRAVDVTNKVLDLVRLWAEEE
jgi:hypothetical protein